MPRNCSTAACQSARLQRGSRLRLRTEPGHPDIGGDEDADGIVDLLGIEVVVKQEEDLCGRAKWRCCGCLAAVITQKLHAHARSAAMALGAAPDHCCQDCPPPCHGAAHESSHLSAAEASRAATVPAAQAPRIRPHLHPSLPLLRLGAVQ